MNTRDKARELAGYGRYGDSLLLHVHPIELGLLNWATRSLGGRGVTINPVTGLPEAFTFWDVLPIIAGAAGTAVGGPMGGMAASSLAGAGKTAAQGGTAQQALLSGLISGATSAAAPGAGSAVGDVAGQAAGQAATEAGTQAATQAATQGLAGKTAADMALQQYGSNAAQAAIPQAAELATAGPLAGAGSAAAQASALPPQALTPGMEPFGIPPATAAAAPVTPSPVTPPASTAAPTGPSTPSDLKAWETTQPQLQAGEEAAQSPWLTKAKEFATSKYALPVGMMAASGIGSLTQNRKVKDEKYTPAEWRMKPRYLGGPSPGERGEHRYFSYAQGRAVDMNADHGDGMADKTPAAIDGHQPAALSSGEYVVPADVVSHLGNGSSGAGVKALDDMLARVRQTRTGGISQARKINPKKVMPK